MTDPNNPFAPPTDGGGKMIFGTYQMVANRVAFGTAGDGTSYELPRYTDKDGNPRAFKGKKLEPKSKNVHIIQDVTCERQDGSEYVAFRDWMWSAKDVCYKAVIASHKHFFGPDLAGINGKKVEAQLEQIEVQDGNYTRQCYKVIKVFKDRAERNAAREEYFSQFTDRKNGAEPQAEPSVTFEPSTLDVIKRHKGKGKTTEQIAAFLLENDLVKEHSQAAVVAAVEQALA